jgi:hypothetical protein
MKTEGLSFLEAVQALRDRKCSGVKHASWVQGGYYIDIDDSGYCVWSNGSTYHATRANQLLSSDWQLIDRVPEKKTVKGWVNIYASSHELYPFQCAFAHESKEKAMDRRYPGIKYLGDPLYIEHEYEVKP